MAILIDLESKKSELVAGGKKLDGGLWLCVYWLVWASVTPLTDHLNMDFNKLL